MPTDVLTILGARALTGMVLAHKAGQFRLQHQKSLNYSPAHLVIFISLIYTKIGTDWFKIHLFINMQEHTLQWHHNEHDGISSHQHLDCLVNRLFRHRSKKISKLCISGLCEGNPPVTSGFPSQMASNMENVPIWWHHHHNLNTMHVYPSMQCPSFVILSLTSRCQGEWVSIVILPGLFTLGHKTGLPCQPFPSFELRQGTVGIRKRLLVVVRAAILATRQLWEGRFHSGHQFLEKVNNRMLDIYFSH